MNDLGKQVCRCIVGACDDTCKYYDAEKACCVGYEEVAEQTEKAFEEYKNYKDLEEQGKLLKLPCAVGDTLYCDGKYFASHCEGEIHSFKVSDIVTEIRSYFRGEVDYCFDFEDVGKTVFLTREEAEAALKEMSE